MSIIFKERFRELFDPALTGHIIMDLGYFLKCEKPTYKFTKTQEDIWNTIGNKLPRIFVFYKNKDSSAEPVYIHNARYLGFPSHASFGDRVDKDGVTLDLSGLNIPESFNVLESTGKNFTHFPYTPYVPSFFAEEVDMYLSTMSLADKKKFISILLFSDMYNYIDSVRDKNWLHTHESISIVKEQEDLEFILMLLKETLDLAYKHGIYVSDSQLMEYAMNGSYYVGFKRYTKEEISAMHKTNVHNVNYMDTCFVSTEESPDIVNVFIKQQTVDLVSSPKHDEYYNDLCIKDIPFMVNKLVESRKHSRK